jgi:hypothetical protein
MEEVSTVDLSNNWNEPMKYLIAVIESHAKKSYFETVDGESAKAIVREYLMRCAEVANIAVKMNKKDK